MTFLSLATTGTFDTQKPMDLANGGRSLHLSKTLAVNETFKIYHPRGHHLSKALAVNETFKINHPHGFHLSKTLAVNKNFEIYHSHGLHLSKTHAVNENFLNLPTSWDPFVENHRCER